MRGIDELYAWAVGGSSVLVRSFALFSVQYCMYFTASTLSFATARARSRWNADQMIREVVAVDAKVDDGDFEFGLYCTLQKEQRVQTR